MLAEILGIKKGDVVSITGSSGKTSLMFSLSQELKSNPVLVSTTTKILMPKPGLYDYLYIGSGVKTCRGVTVFAEAVTPEGKLAGGADKLNELTPLFDYTIIESDGASRKPLKAWNEYEPVIIPKTTKTVGVISVRLIGAKIDESSIHRLDIFRREYSNQDKILSINHLLKVILDNNGLFKNALGERILYINMVETEREAVLAAELCKLLSANAGPDRIICGSIRDSRFFIPG